jgi:hypothetical protein
VAAKIRDDPHKREDFTFQRTFPSVQITRLIGSKSNHSGTGKYIRPSIGISDEDISFGNDLTMSGIYAQKQPTHENADLSHLRSPLLSGL